MTDSLFRDVRYVLRSLARTPGFTVVAILTLALGIGATTTIFSVVYGLLLRPLPYRDADRIVMIEAYRSFAGRPATRWNYSYPDLEEWRTRSRSFTSIALFRHASFAFAGDHVSEEVRGAVVSDDFFEVADGPFALGLATGFTDNTSLVAVISERFWTDRFGRSPSVIGQRITLNETPYTVVGVAASTFQLPDDDADIWVPAPFLDSSQGALGQGGFNPIARLRTGVTLAQAQADADNLSRELAGTYPKAHTGVTATVVGLRTSIVGNVQAALLLLSGAAGLLLLVACANVANLLVGRGVSRAKEMAIRAAVGASRSRLITQSLIDATALAAIGCVAGVGVAYWSVGLLVWLEPSALPRLDAIHVDIPVLAFAVAVAFGTSLVVGLVSTFYFSLGAEPLKVSAQAGTPGFRGSSVGRGLAVTQLAAAVVLLVCTALLGRSLVNLLTTDMGVPSDHVAAVLVELRGARPLEPAQLLTRLDAVVERVGALPGIESAALTSSLPPNLTRFQTSFSLVDSATGRPTEYLVGAVPVTPEFFSTLRLPLVKGRLFSDADSVGAPLVMLVSTSTARRFFGDRDPIGRTLPIGDAGADGQRTPVTIVGVVGDVRYVGLDTPPGSTLYLPYAQRVLPNPFVVARTTGEPQAALAAMRSAIGRVDPGISIVASETLDGFVGYATAAPRLRTLLLSTIAGLGLILAAIGVYGVIAYAVVQRTREIGIRMAIGATSTQVASMMLREGATLAIIGLAIGLSTAYVISSVLTQLLYGVTPTDGTSFMLAATALLLVALLATYVPARRAARVDPLIAIKAE